MGKDKKQSKVGFQFTALQKRIKLLDAKVLILTEENRRLKAEAREEWRKDASQEAATILAQQIEKDLYDRQPRWVGLNAQLAPKKSWWKRLFG